MGRGSSKGMLLAGYLAGQTSGAAYRKALRPNADRAQTGDLRSTAKVRGYYWGYLKKSNRIFIG